MPLHHLGSHDYGTPSDVTGDVTGSASLDSLPLRQTKTSLNSVTSFDNGHFRLKLYRLCSF